MTLSEQDTFREYLDDIKQRVEESLRSRLRVRQTRLEAIDPEIANELIDVLITFSTTGKMLRAALVDLGYRIADQDERDPALRPIQAAVELAHASLLIHDDIVDDSDLRRGQPTMHRIFAAVHGEKGYTGNSDVYGRSMAMMIGDIAMSLAFSLALGSGFPEDRKNEGIDHFNENLIKTGVGQAMDLNLMVRSDVNVTQINTMTRHKTAYYTVVAPLQLGGIVGGVSPQTRGDFEGFGIPLGEAYQLQDDLLGVFGEEDVIHKSPLSDLREGKRTLLFHYGLEWAQGNDKEHLRNTIGKKQAGQADLDRVRETLTRCGARQKVTEEMEQLKDVAKRSIGAFDAKDPRVEELLHLLCDYMVRRND